MGLTTWADAPEGKIKKSDVAIAKNYLSQDEMKQLNRMVTAYSGFSENMTLRHIPLTMQLKRGKASTPSLKCLITVFYRIGKVSAEIANRRQNLKNIVSSRTDCLCLILISTCWNWKRMRRSSSIAIKISACQGRRSGSFIGSKIAFDMYYNKMLGVKGILPLT